jgi:AraC-like DNA-binding protein
LECGFNSKSSFNRNFKKFSGQTPSEFLSVAGQ